jgi:hypothetical protein
LLKFFPYPVIHESVYHRHELDCVWGHMGRLKSALITPALCLSGFGLLTACAVPAETSANPPGASAMQAAPQNLIGSTPQVLDAEFGQPTLLRVDGTAQVWLYHSASCGLNLFLYPDASGVPRVTMATTADGGRMIGDCPVSLEQSHIDAATTLPAGATAAALEPPASS